MSAQDTAIDAVVKGWRGYRGGDVWGKAKAALDGLAAAGHAVVELPEPTTADDSSGLIAGWDVGPNCVDVWKHEPGLVHVDLDTEFFTPAEARELVAALSAAANKAESDE